MEFRPSAELWERFPRLAAGVLGARVGDLALDADAVGSFLDQARDRDLVESELPQLRAWRGSAASWH